MVLFWKFLAIFMPMKDTQLQLFMLLLGCKPSGRHTEQHDIFFGIGQSLKDLIPQMEAFWPEAGKIHLDAWRPVTRVGDYKVVVVSKQTPAAEEERQGRQLYFLNLGGYKPGCFDEFHYKVLTIEPDSGSAIQTAKMTTFFRHELSPHIDDKYGIDVDDIYNVEEILPPDLKENYRLAFFKPDAAVAAEDEWNIGYTKLSNLL